MSAGRQKTISFWTTRRYLAILTAQEDLEELSKAADLSKETLTAVQTRVRAAKAPQAEEARAHAQVARMRLEQEHTEHQLAAARQRLAALWGATEAEFGHARGELLALPEIESFEGLRERLQRNPEFERLVSERRLREAEPHLAEARRRAHWQVTARQKLS